MGRTSRQVSLSIAALLGLAAVLNVLSPSRAWPGQAYKGFANPQPVTLIGYSGHAMEPFISRDGRMLLFNNSNDPNENTELHWAERVTDVSFRYRGKIDGANSPALDGVPSLDQDGLLYFVTTRSYEATLSTIYRVRFRKGVATDPELVKGLSLNTPGMVNFDLEISADGQWLIGVDGDLTGGPVPRSADMFLARRIGDGFERFKNSAALMREINTPDLEYAPAISADGRELFFTRMSGALFWRKFTIEHAVRATADEPFGPPKTIAAIEGVVEAPSLSSDGRTLYYHAKVDDLYRLFAVTRP
jgi:Tol biopolymer transport system component